TVPGRLLCHEGLAKTWLVPPPEPSRKPKFCGGSKGAYPVSTVSLIHVALWPQPVCHAMLLSGFSARLVPPTAVTNGDEAGKSGVLTPNTVVLSPKSPDETLTSMPCAAASSRIRLIRLLRPNGPAVRYASIAPQLLEIVSPR